MILVRIHPAPEVRAADIRQIAVSVDGCRVCTAMWLIILIAQEEAAPLVATDDELAMRTGMPADVIRQAIPVMQAYNFQVDYLTPDATDVAILKFIRESAEPISNQAIADNFALSKHAVPDRCRKLEQAGLITHPKHRDRCWTHTAKGLTFNA